ncbi:hypothetical protein B0H66DRAFT_570096 [Apodospora peruviana]|uniref:Uncharacterized protein n=1 Tax=Apodospora peruviana TaxID=516989 RepID=A0AAE0HT30_9PEZI|nr:hypothetical protein B0H66DRAFT_570096 [Apodospora peruviana]
MPDFTLTSQESDEHRSQNDSWALVPTTGKNEAADAQALVASRLWGRRYSDSSSQLSEDHPLHHKTPKPNPYIPQPPPKLQLPNHTGLTFYFATQTINNNNITITRPAEDVVDESSSSPQRSPRTHHRRASVAKDNAVLKWAEFREDVIPRHKTPIQTSHDEVIDAFTEVEAGPVKGLGRLAKPIIHKFHANTHISEFQAYERAILRPLPPHGQDEASTPTTAMRELKRLESELFDTAKYLGNTDHLTVLTWSSDSHWGSITLFQVGLEGRGGRGVSIRPVAAMEDVPKGILVNMRVDQSVRKVVLEYNDNRFRWRAQVRPGPCYARVIPKSGNSNAVFTDSGDDEDEDEDMSERREKTVRGRKDRREYEDGGFEGGEGGGGRPRRSTRRRPRPSSLLRVDYAATRSSRRTRSYSSGGGSRSRREKRRAEKDAETGVVATIPQFLALLHANRSIVEVISSAEDGDEVVEVTDGRAEVCLRAVTLTDRPPLGRRHAGHNVHVVVLMPSASDWAEEPIFWTDETDEISEFRQKVFWDVIEREREEPRERRRTTTRRRYRDWDDSDRSRSPPRSAKW